MNDFNKMSAEEFEALTADEYCNFGEQLVAEIRRLDDETELDGTELAFAALGAIGAYLYQAVGPSEATSQLRILADEIQKLPTN